MELKGSRGGGNPSHLKFLIAGAHPKNLLKQQVPKAGACLMLKSAMEVKGNSAGGNPIHQKCHKAGSHPKSQLKQGVPRVGACQMQERAMEMKENNSGDNKVQNLGKTMLKDLRAEDDYKLENLGKTMLKLNASSGWGAEESKRPDSISGYTQKDFAGSGGWNISADWGREAKGTEKPIETNPSNSNSLSNWDNKVTQNQLMSGWASTAEDWSKDKHPAHKSYMVLSTKRDTYSGNEV